MIYPLPKALALISVLSFLYASPLVAQTTPPVPLPPDAASVNYDAKGGSLEFETPTAVKQLAEFYRAAMKKLGWSEQHSVINNDNMVALMFSKGEDEITFTLMRMGDHTQFSGEVAALQPKSSSDANTTDDSGSGTQTKIGDIGADVALTAEDNNGIPIPSEHTSSGSEQTLFRKNVMVTVSANVASVVKFFRTELIRLREMLRAERDVFRRMIVKVICQAQDDRIHLQGNRQGPFLTFTGELRSRAIIQ